MAETIRPATRSFYLRALAGRFRLQDRAVQIQPPLALPVRFPSKANPSLVRPQSVRRTEEIQTT
ncbi:MAG: hypothetical protein KatS3mg004_3786 [Bryobacteraceae bacterium]|nr:MAG: hypothetical protein KatS3mg004_3786 [Bryobacteraceae bacterium]